MLVAFSCYICAVAVIFNVTVASFLVYGVYNGLQFFHMQALFSCICWDSLEFDNDLYSKKTLTLCGKLVKNVNATVKYSMTVVVSVSNVSDCGVQ